MAEPADHGEKHDRELLTRRHLARLLFYDFLITSVWIIIAAGIWVETEHTTFLGIESWVIRVVVILLAIVPTGGLTLIAWDDLDELWMVARTKRFERRQRFREMEQRSSASLPDRTRALPPHQDRTQTPQEEPPVGGETDTLA